MIRHTFISYLVRQGIRFSDLARVVGTLPAEVTAAYGALLPPGSRRSFDQTDSIIPALRQFVQKIFPAVRACLRKDHAIFYLFPIGCK